MINDQKATYLQENVMKTGKRISQSDESGDDHLYEAPETFIRQMLSLHNKGIMNDQNMRDNAFLMIAAGSESSTMTLSFGVLMLAMHPKVQMRAAAEIDQIFADLAPDQGLDYKHISKLEYLDQVLRETMR